jgi:chromosome segregation ATPase
MGEALNAEAVLASFVEIRGSIVELRESIAEQGRELRESIAEQGKELRESIAEQGRRIDKLVEEFAETRAEFVEVKAELKENNRKLDENNHRVGDLTNKLGRIVEKIVLPGIVDKFNEKGFKFDSVSANVEFLNEKKNGKLAELDALLENGKFAIAIETKTELTIKDVNKYMKRLQALRKVPRFKGKKIYGAFSTAVAEPKSINYALEKGFYVLQQPDKMAIRILDFPKGHSAKAW